MSKQDELHAAELQKQRVEIALLREQLLSKV